MHINWYNEWFNTYFKLNIIDSYKSEIKYTHKIYIYYTRSRSNREMRIDNVQMLLNKL